jgi:hypothetical protein
LRGGLRRGSSPLTHEYVGATQVRPAQRRSFGERKVRRWREIYRLIPKEFAVESKDVAGGEQKSCVDAAIAQRGQLLDRIQLDEIRSNIRPIRPIIISKQFLQTSRRERLIDCDRQYAGFCSSSGGDRLRRLIDFRKHKINAREERPAGVRQHDAITAALENRRPNLNFERANATAQHRLLDAEGFGGAAKTRMFSGAKRRVKRDEVHGERNLSVSIRNLWRRIGYRR